MAFIEGEYTRYNGAMRQYDRFDPLLVNLHDNLKSLKCDKENVGLYANVEEAILDLLDARLHANERSVVADIVISIIKQARADIKKSLSEKLSVRNDLHQSLLHYLAYEDIMVAEPILLNSVQLSDVDIMYIIQAKDKEHWRVIARRPNLNEEVIICLAAKKDDYTNVHLLENETVVLSESVLKQIATSSNHEIVAERLINYKNLPQEVAISIYWHVSNAMKQEIKERFASKNQAVNEALEDSIRDFTDTVLQTGNMQPSKLMIEVAESYAREGRLNEEMLVDCLRRRQGRFFIALFARWTGLSHSVIASMMRQTSGHSLAVACRATSISKKNFVSIFLLTGALARSDNPVGADELRMAIRYYEGLTLKTAKEILADSIAA